MSSSQFSLATSADLQTISSKTVQDVVGQCALSSSQDLRSSTRRQRNSAIDFYEQVDERMSRNSCEYPAYQAKYVDQWLEAQTSNNTTAKKSDDQQMPCPVSNSESSLILKLDQSHESTTKLRDQWGNIIGIRGYPKECRTATGDDDDFHRSQSCSRRDYNKLKFDHTRLKSTHERLKKHICLMAKKFKHLLRGKDHEIDMLKSLMSKVKGNSLSSRIISFNGGFQYDEKELHRQLKELNEKLADNHSNNEFLRLLWQLEQENATLRRELVERKTDHEQQLKVLRLQIDKYQNEPSQAMLLKLKNENNHLKEINEYSRQEFQTLRDEYEKLEGELKKILSGQSEQDKDRAKDVSNLSLELSRLQVYQTKLESILETERAIKQELERQLDQSKRELNSFKERMKKLNRELVDSESRQERASSSEVKKMQLELMRWQEKCDRIAREKSDISELLRATRCKLDQMETRQSLELERLADSRRSESDSMEAKLKLNEMSRTKLQLTLEEASKNLANCQEERERLTSENLKLKHEIELKLLEADSFELAKSRSKGSEQQIELLQRQLKQCESSRRDLERERDNSADRIQLGREQLSELRQRFKLQQETFDKFKVAKEQELDRLRVNLNFEHYNRRVALGSIEKELRHSLQELASMKCRFVQRIGAAAAASSSPAASSSTAAGTSLARQCDGIRDRRHKQQCCQQKPANVIEVDSQLRDQRRQRQQQVNSSFDSPSSSCCSDGRHLSNS